MCEEARCNRALALSRASLRSHVRHYTRKTHRRQRYLTGRTKKGGHRDRRHLKPGPRIQFDNVRVHTSLAGAGGRHILSVLIVRGCVWQESLLSPRSAASVHRRFLLRLRRRLLASFSSSLLLLLVLWLAARGSAEPDHRPPCPGGPPGWSASRIPSEDTLSAREQPSRLYLSTVATHFCPRRCKPSVIFSAPCDRERRKPRERDRVRVNERKRERASE